MTRVLVVDDNADNLYLLTQLLQGHGYQVDVARHGADALRLARQSPPGLVVSDLLMPVMDGYALLRDWKADGALCDVPFIVYTATYTDPKDEQLALDMGADAFIVKPAEPEAFIVAVQGVLDKTEHGELAPTHRPQIDAGQALTSHNAALVRKLEDKARQLEQRVAEREAALRSLKASEVQFGALVDHSLDMILQTSPDGSVQSANPAACRAFGLSEAQIMAAGRTGLVDPDDPRLAAFLAERAATGLASGELTLIRADGTRFAAECSSVVYRDAEGRERTSMTLRDLTARKQAEAELRASNAHIAKLQAALDAHALLSITDADGRITYANDRFCSASGFARDELIGRTHSLVKSGLHSSEFFARLWNTIRAGRVWKGEICNRAKAGQLFWVDATIVPYLDEQGMPSQYVAIRTDVTERKHAEAQRLELEAQLREAQKIQAVGTLASGIAHDFNNIVGAILGYVALARQDLAAGMAAGQHLQRIETAGQRARSLVQRILSFSRPQPTTLDNLVLQASINETVGVLQATLPTVVTLETRLPDEPVHVLADGTQLQQVLLNLCTNAWHALRGSTGRIEIGLEALAHDAAARPAELPPGPFAHVWVSDNGCGMDDATRARIFEPFFTTKPVGQGTGLGLAAVHGIVGAHHGAILVDSQPGRGSSFHLYFPRVAPGTVLPALPPAEATMPAMGGTGHVLYVDDDESMALLADALLSRAGCQVTTFVEAERALEAVRASPDAFDLVVTDFNMPRLSGLDLARELRSIRGGLPVIIGSGHIDEQLRDDAARLGIEALLNKERIVEDLVPLARRVLTPPRGRA